MNSLQLNCPHCQSTLSFGLEITPGTTVACLICGRPFRVPAFTPAPASPLPPVASLPPPPVKKRRAAPRADLPA